MGSEHYCLRWNNHQSNLLGVFSQLLRDESLVDVTLACSEGHSIRAHKVVLSACSSYFQTLFVDHPSRHPIVILKDVRFSELRTLVEFMYKGEVNVEYCQLSALLKTAESLKVKGLAEMTNLGSASSTSTSKDEREAEQRERERERGRERERDRDRERDAEQTEPTELVTKRLTVKEECSDTPPPVPVPLSALQPPMRTTCGSPAPLALRRRSDTLPDDRPVSTETLRPDTPESELASTHTSCGPSDMSINNNNITSNNNNTNSNNNNATVTSCAALPGGLLGTAPSVCSRLPSPHADEPIAGPSGMPPVQQVPLSLKKEVDWSAAGFAEEKSTGECSSDYRHSHDSSALELERCFGSPSVMVEHATSTHSSRSSTPFAFPFPSFGSAVLEDTSSRLLGLLHPALLTDDTFRCPVCLAAFPSIWLLEQHTALQHLALGHFGTEDKPFVCDQCGQSYRYRSAYIKHREQNHRARLPADKLFSCDVCGMQFRYLKSFKKHRLNHALERLHGKSTDIMITTDSGNVSNNYDSDVQFSENKEAAAVAVAGESGSNQVSSSNETVTSEPSITIKKEVAYAEADAEEAGDAAENASTDSEKTSARAADCDQDDTIDSIAFSLSAVRSSGGASQEASILNILRMDAAERQRERRFACPFCGKCVRSKENLKLHVRKHTGERPFVCLFCGRAFGGKSDLTRHLRIHTGERPYHCEMCGKCFARADYLSKHLTTHIHTPR